MMKVSLAFGLIFIVVGGSASQWKEIKSPIASEMFSDSRRTEETSERRSFEGENPLIADFEDNSRSGRIINGNPAKLGDFPYQVYMISTRSDGSPWLCGGSVGL
jgi:hypothetical protein